MLDRFRKDRPESKVDIKVRTRAKVNTEVATDTDTPFMVFLDKVASVAIITLFIVAIGSISIIIL